MKTLKERAIDLFNSIESGKTLEAIEKYYDENVEMQENDSAPRTGKPLNIEHEKDNLRRMKDLNAKVKSYSINEETNIVFSE